MDFRTSAPFVECIHSAPKSSGGPPSLPTNGVDLSLPQMTLDASRIVTLVNLICLSESAADRPAMPAPMMIMASSLIDESRLHYYGEAMGAREWGEGWAWLGTCGVQRAP